MSEVLHQCGTGSLEQSGLRSEVCDIDYKLHAIIASRKRCVIQSIQEETATNIYFPTSLVGVLNPPLPGTQLGVGYRNMDMGGMNMQPTGMPMQMTGQMTGMSMGGGMQGMGMSNQMAGGMEGHGIRAPVIWPRVSSARVSSTRVPTARLRWLSSTTTRQPPTRL